MQRIDYVNKSFLSCNLGEISFTQVEKGRVFKGGQAVRTGVVQKQDNRVHTDKRNVRECKKILINILTGLSYNEDISLVFVKMTCYTFDIIFCKHEFQQKNVRFLRELNDLRHKIFIGQTLRKFVEKILDQIIRKLLGTHLSERLRITYKL